MLFQDDVSTSLPHGYDSVRQSHQNTKCYQKQTTGQNCLENINTESQRPQIFSCTANTPNPPLPSIDLPPLPVDSEPRPPSPPAHHPGRVEFGGVTEANAVENMEPIYTTDSQTKLKAKNYAYDILNGREKEESTVMTETDVSCENAGLRDNRDEVNEETEDEWSETDETMAHDLLDADLTEKAVSKEKLKEKKKEPYEKIRSFLVDRGKNHFTVLPEGWIQVRHFSGMPVYLHKQTRVVTLSKPYVLGPLSVKSHHIPLGSIPCLNYKKAKEEEEILRLKMADTGASLVCPIQKQEDKIKNRASDHICDKDNVSNEAKIGSTECKPDCKEAAQYSKQALPNTFPMAKISSLGESKKSKSLTPDEFKKYCSHLFEFREVKMKSFPNWKQKRIYNKEVNAKRLKAQVKKSLESSGTLQKEGKKLENPSLPDFKLITIPILEMQKNDEKSHDTSAFNKKITKKSKKEWIFNPKNKTPVCILHEYLQHSIRKPPEYKYSEIDSPKTPYSAVVLIGRCAGNPRSDPSNLGLNNYFVAKGPI